jgi:pyridoxal phosphate enzyme (YggS family)
LVSSPALPNGLCERWNAVRARIERAASRAGRPPPRLVAVTKSTTPERALELARLGALDLGESRVQSLEAKVAHFRAQGVAARWHLVGHLQRNKARRAVAACCAIHSVDSLDLGLVLSRLCGELGARPELFVEVDYTGGDTRTGVAESAVPALVAALAPLPHFALAGLMTIAPVPAFDGDTRRARQVFAQLRRLGERLPAEHFASGRPLLSMGMSSDFEIAIEEGSDCVRVGGALFADEGAGT